MSKYLGLDLLGRPMRCVPWDVSDRKNQKLYDGLGPRRVPGTTFGEWIDHFERCGGEVDTLIGLLNTHALPGYAVTRADLVDGTRTYGPEYYFYFVMFMKKLMNDFSFCCPIPESGLYSRYHRYYERGPIVDRPWGKDEEQKAIPGLGILNLTFPLRYIEDELGMDAAELVAWMNRFVDDLYAVPKEFFYREVDTTHCSYEYVLVFLSLAEAFLNDGEFLERAFFLFTADGARTLYANYLNVPPKHALKAVCDMRNALSGAYRDELVWGLFSLKMTITVFDERFRKQIGAYVRGVLDCGLPIQCGALIAVMGYIHDFPFSVASAETICVDVDHYGFKIVFRRWIEGKRVWPYLCAGVLGACLGFPLSAFGAGPFGTISAMLVLSVAGIVIARERAARLRAERRLEASGQGRERQLALLKRTNDELLEERANLELRVRERTAELAEAHLELKAQDEAKTRFFENISHELRTPIALIRSPLESIARGEYGDRIARSSRLFTIMYRNALRLARLTDDLLSAMKIETGNMYLSPEAFDAAKTVENYLSEFESLASMKGVSLHMAPHVRGTAFILADPRSFETIMLNLLSNAVKFTKPGGFITVCISAMEEEGKLFLSVCDTGVGIAESKNSLVFERFKRIYDAERHEYDGCGIGLPLSRELARLQGGDITFKSREGEGSVFTVELPIAAREAESAAICVQASQALKDRLVIDAYREGPHSTDQLAPRIHAFEAGRRPHILVVDDNRDLVDLLTESLGGNYEVDAAFNGDEALAAMLRGVPPDLVISDIMMPGMDGIEFMRRAREDNRVASVPFLFLTARAAEEEKIRVLQEGAADYIYKPFSMEMLKAKLAAILAVRDATKKEMEHRILRAMRNNERATNCLTLQERLERFALSPRELDIARSLLDGLSDKEIAELLKLSTKTVSHHASSVYRKVGVSGRMEFVRVVSDSGRR